MAHDTGKQAALGRVLVALSALAWSTAGIFTKGVEADGWTVLLWRRLLAGGVMSAWLVWRRGRAGLADWKQLGWAGWSAATVSSAATICFIPRRVLQRRQVMPFALGGDKDVCGNDAEESGLDREEPMDQNADQHQERQEERPASQENLAPWSDS